MLVSRFVAALRAQFPELLGKHVLVALSGGGDSVALLRLLVAGSAELGTTVAACHVHHHVRGADADGDASFCVRACAGLGLELHLEHLVPEPPRGVSPEAWWRAERYRLLETVRRRSGCATVATAHTRDDQAETVLLKLLRGSGPRGVAGVRRRQGCVVRPLLDFDRNELRAWLSATGGEWREDASNADATQPRARIRHDLLPALAAYAPSTVEHLASFADALAEDEEVLGALLAERAAWPEVGVPIPVAPVAGLPLSLRRRWVLELAGRLPLGEPPSRRQLAEVEALLAGGPPAAVDLGRRWVVRRRGSALVLSPPPAPPFGDTAATLGSDVALPGGFCARVGRSGEAPAFSAVLRAAVCGLPLAWRSVRPAERLPWPPGCSLAAALGRAGVPAEWRRAWPVLVSGDTMLWVPGVGVAPGWDAGGVTGTVAELEEPWQRRERS